jgi:hypothetical protein
MTSFVEALSRRFAAQLVEAQCPGTFFAVPCLYRSDGRFQTKLKSPGGLEIWFDLRGSQIEEGGSKCVIYGISRYWGF